MNRTIVGGIAVFFVVLAIAVMGGQNDANAGWGCQGGCGGLFKRARCHGGLFAGHRCHGAADCGGVSCGGGDCGGSSCGGSDCGGRHHVGLFARMRARRCQGACHGAPTCCGVPVCEPACDPCADCGAAPCSDCTVVEPSCGVMEYEAAPSTEVAPEVPEAPAAVEG